MAEYQLPKLVVWVRFPSPAPYALIAQTVERFHGKEEVIGSIPIEGSSEGFGRKCIEAFLFGVGSVPAARECHVRCTHKMKVSETLEP